MYKLISVELLRDVAGWALLRYDLVVLGGGAAGFSAATVAAERGAKVLLASLGPLGGTCVNYGCVPTKYMLSRLSVAKKSNTTVGLRELLREAKKVSSELRRERYESLIESLGIDYVEGEARFRSRGVVKVEGREFKYKSAVIAVGAKAGKPPIKGLEEVEDRILDNEKLFKEDVDFSKIVIIGGRAQGVEIAQVMARSRIDTVLLQRSSRLLPQEEPEVGLLLKQVLSEDGVKVETGVSLLGVKKSSNSVKVYYRGENGVEKVEEADYIYLATGRKPILEKLALERVGVQVSPEGFIVVDEHLQAAKGVYAAGDCINGYMLEPIAAREGYVAAVNALGGNLVMDYTVVPRAVFTDPEFTKVGLTEREYAEKTGTCTCRVVDITNVPKAKILGYDRGFVKMVVDPKTKRIVGVHVVAPNAAETIHEAALAIKCNMTVDDIIDVVHVFPTISEALKYAALAFYRDVSKMPCCLL